MARPRVTNLSKQRRDFSLDVVKGALILSVVLGHDSDFISMYPSVTKALYAFHVPAFLLISCFFIKPSEKAKVWLFAKKRFVNLVPPMLLIFSIVFLVKNLTGGSKQTSLSEMLMACITGLVFANSTSFENTTGATYLWFVPAVLVLNVLYFTLLKYGGNIYLRYAVSLIFLIAVFFGVDTEMHCWVPWGIDVALLLCPLCLLASELYRRGVFTSSRTRLVALLGFPFLLWLVIEKLTYVGLQGFYLPQGLIYFLLWWNYVVLGLVLVYWVASCCLNTGSTPIQFAANVLKRLGEASLWIYLLHPFFSRGVDSIASACLGSEEDRSLIPVMVIRIVLGVTGPLMVETIVKKKLSAV